MVNSPISRQRNYDILTDNTDKSDNFGDGMEWSGDVGDLTNRAICCNFAS